MKHPKLTSYQMTATALMSAVLCVLAPLSLPIGIVHLSLANLVICFAVWLLGARLATLSVGLYLALGAAGLPVFTGYGAGFAKLAGPTGGYLVGYLFMAAIGGWFMEKSRGQPVLSGLGLALGIVASYLCGTAWFMLQMSCSLHTALTICVYPFIPFDLLKIGISCVVGPLLRHRLQQAGARIR